jgi:hypothetical protein
MGILLGMFKQGKLPPRRATKRISMQMRFVVSGRDENGSEFKTMAETSIVTGQGGCLILDKDVSEGQNLKLCAENGKAFFANVRWFGYDPLKNRRYAGFKVLGEMNDWALNVVSHLEHLDFKTVEQMASRAVRVR